MDVKFLTGTDETKLPAYTVGQVYFIYDIPIQGQERKIGKIVYDSPTGRIAMNTQSTYALNDNLGNNIEQTYAKKADIQHMVIEILGGMEYEGDFEEHEEEIING